ncbi:MAG: 16S rRNA (uracil(1498)-N(3))-methyltransferase [Betaproteobacteria bacterium]
MAKARFFVEGVLGPSTIGTELELPEAVAHHAVRVLRLAAGDALTLFDGSGGEYAATLVDAAKRGARVRVDRFDGIDRESPLVITLVQAVAANDAMDYAVRKAVELGVTAIAPVMMARSAPLRAGERAERRRQHWQQIAIAACEQSGRNAVPPVAAPCTLQAWIADWHGTAFMCVPEGAPAWSTLARPAGSVAVVVGPEGGITGDEIKRLQKCGVQPLRLGPRTLRTETAGVVALALMQAWWGDLK